MGKISYYITTTKHNKVYTVCKMLEFMISISTYIVWHTLFQSICVCYIVEPQGDFSLILLINILGKTHVPDTLPCDKYSQCRNEYHNARPTPRPDPKDTQALVEDVMTGHMGHRESPWMLHSISLHILKNYEEISVYTTILYHGLYVYHNSNRINTSYICKS